MLRGYLKVRESCPVCGEALHHQRADDGPAYITILIVGHVVAPLMLWAFTRWEPDPLILDDQALVVNVRGLGLVVVTGCGHAGAVNIARYAVRLTGVSRLYGMLGGFHLGGPAFEPIIEPTVSALEAMAPSLVVPAHCTGWKAQHRLAAALPDSFVPNAVGTSYRVQADQAA